MFHHLKILNQIESVLLYGMDSPSEELRKQGLMRMGSYTNA